MSVPIPVMSLPRTAPRSATWHRRSRRIPEQVGSQPDLALAVSVSIARPFVTDVGVALGCRPGREGEKKSGAAIERDAIPEQGIGWEKVCVPASPGQATAGLAESGRQISSGSCHARIQGTVVQ